MCYGNTQHLPRRSQRRRVATLVVFALIFPIREASASPTAASESNQQSTREESLPIEECQISDAAREALKNAWAARVQTPEIPKFLELYQQAQTAAKPPECDSVKARMLADKARQLADECSKNESALSAIEAANSASNEKGRPIDVEDLIYQAKVALSPPECDVVRAKNLADKAKQMAYSDKSSISDIWDSEGFWILLSMFIGVAF